MRTLYPATFYKLFLNAFTIAASILHGSDCFSQSGTQSVLEYSFTNPVLETGVAGTDGAVYRFSNVAANIDALVTINGRSSNLVTLDNVDVTGLGYDKAFQPLVTYNGDTATGPLCWWMEFNVSFVKSGKKAPAKMDSLYATALDVDGDSYAIQEQFTAFGAAGYTVSSPTNLAVTSVSGGSQFTGPIANSPGIDTSATNVMVTLSYVNQNSITFRYGGQITSSLTSGAANRYNSIWFKAFNYNSLSILPVAIVSFDAKPSNNSKVTLDWITSNEIKASHFIVERSTDGRAFDEEGIIFSNENSNVDQAYSFSDNINTTDKGLIYYRLKMVDMDGGYKYSEIVVVRLTGEQAQVNVVVYPNPTVNELRVAIPVSWQNRTVAYGIYNLSGSLVKLKTINNPGQTESFDVSAMPAGTYFIQTMAGSEMAIQKFIKVH